MAELLSKPEFRDALENAIKGSEAKRRRSALPGPAASSSRDHLARWAENHYHYVGPFADYLGYIYARTPDHATDAKDFLLQNMYEEEIGGDPPHRPADPLRRGLRHHPRAGDGPRQHHAVTRGLQSWCYAVAMREDFAVAVAALVVGLESQVPSIYRKQTPTLREKYGFTDEEVEFFDLHIVSDEIHGERGYQIVLEHADTPELQQRCLRSAGRRPDALLYTTALYDTYVAPDLEGRRQLTGPNRRWPDRSRPMPRIRFHTTDSRSPSPTATT